MFNKQSLSQLRLLSTPGSHYGQLQTQLTGFASRLVSEYPYIKFTLCRVFPACRQKIPKPLLRFGRRQRHFQPIHAYAKAEKPLPSQEAQAHTVSVFQPPGLKSDILHGNYPVNRRQPSASTHIIRLFAVTLKTRYPVGQPVHPTKAPSSFTLNAPFR